MESGSICVQDGPEIARETTLATAVGVKSSRQSWRLIEIDGMLRLLCMLHSGALRLAPLPWSSILTSPSSFANLVPTGFSDLGLTKIRLACPEGGVKAAGKSFPS